MSARAHVHPMGGGQLSDGVMGVQSLPQTGILAGLLFFLFHFALLAYLWRNNLHKYVSSFKQMKMYSLYSAVS